MTKNEAKKNTDPIVNRPNDAYMLEAIKDMMVPIAQTILALRNQSTVIGEAESPILEDLAESASQVLDDLNEGCDANNYEVLMVSATAMATSALVIDNKDVAEDILALQELADIGLGIEEMPEHLYPLHQVRKKAIHELRRMEKTAYETSDAYTEHVKEELGKRGVVGYSDEGEDDLLDALLKEIQYRAQENKESANA